MRGGIITPKDISSLSNKLEELAAGLPDQEKQILDWLLARAQACTDQELAATELSDAELDAVAGGATEESISALNSQLAESLGFAPTESIDVTVMWAR